MTRSRTRWHRPTALHPRGARPPFQELEAEEQAFEVRETQERTWIQRAADLARAVPGWIKGQLIDLVRTHPYAAAIAVWGFIRSLGVTVQSGQQGLKFSFGRATRTLEPGLHLLVPILQVIRVVPTRSRTLDLEHQQVATLDGLVYQVHASLVWRVVDIRKAVVEIDDLETGMRNALATSVWRVLKDRDREGMRASEDLDAELARRMEERLAPWGVIVERAGFQSIAPCGATLDLLQLRQRVQERERVGRALAVGQAGGPPMPPGAALGLVGAPAFPRRRQVRATWRAAAARRKRVLALQARRMSAAAEEA